MRNYDKAYFERDGDCIEHGDYHCDDCYEKSRSAVALVTTTTSFSNKSDIAENFKKQVNFVKTALDYSDDKISKVRVKDLPKLLEKAQDEITVGKMNAVIKNEGVENFSVVKRIFLALKRQDR